MRWRAKAWVKRRTLRAVRPLKAGLLYFLAVFSAGFLLGTLRVLWLGPLIGERAAELLETPVLLGVAIAAAAWIVRRQGLEPRPGARLAMGITALACVLAAEFALVLPLRGMTPAQYFAALDPLTGAVYYGSLVFVAALPLLAAPAVAARRSAALLSLGAIAATMAAIVYVKYRHDLDAARERVAAGSEVVETRCGPIEYAVVGEGPPVLLVHGAGGGFDQTLDAARELATRGFRVVAPSRFGYLRTPQRSDATPGAQADAHACLLEALKIPRAAVIGVSAGAPSAMQFALRHAGRCTGLVLLVPMAYSPQGGLTRPPASARWLFEGSLGSDFLFWLLAHGSPEKIMGTPADVLQRADAAERARFDRLALQPLPVSERREGLLNDATVVTHLQRYDLERIAVPTLVISARDDLWGTYESSLYTAQHIPGARFLGLPEGGHLWVGRHREVMGEIAAFLTASAR